jgi:N,N'-diacetyllegionaminate synthase
MKKTYIIAEAGVNHNGNLGLAFKLVDAAKKAGADCVKFQTFKASSVVTKNAKMASYQINNTGKDNDQLNMLRELEISLSDFKKIKNYCSDVKIDFLSTPFDFDSIQFLKSLNMKYWKIPSGELTNLPFIETISKINQPIILSTGMADFKEVRDTVKAIQKLHNNELIILHCTTDYPTPISDVNLQAMVSLGQQLNLPYGYSDHTMGILVPIAAVSLGAVIIEKHLTLDTNLPGPDHKASLTPEEFETMVNKIRSIEIILGDKAKKPTQSELKNRLIVRRSIVAKTKINAGDLFTINNITTKRPGNGINPMKWYKVLGKKARKSYEIDDLIEL